MKPSVLALLLLCTIFFSPHKITAQEATADPNPEPILGATYSTADGHLSVSFPKQFALRSFDSPVNGMLIHMASDPDTLKYFPERGDNFRTGNIYIIVNVFERFVLHYPNIEFDNTLDVLSLRKALPTVEPAWEYDELTAVTINDRPAVQTFVKVEDYADEYDLLIDLGDGFLVRVIAFTRPGELQGFDPLIQAIAASVTYRPYTKSDLTETYTSRDGKVSVSYPKGWVTSKRLDIGLFDVELEGENIAFGVTVAKPETEGISFQSYTDALATNLQELPYTIKSSFGSMTLIINEHPAQLMAIPYSNLPQIRVMLVLDLGDGVFASINGLIDKSQFEHWQRMASVIAETIAYNP